MFQHAVTCASCPPSSGALSVLMSEQVNVDINVNVDMNANVNVDVNVHVHVNYLNVDVCIFKILLIRAAFAREASERCRPDS